MCHKAQEYHLTNRYGKETEMITELHVALLPRSVCSQRGANERVTSPSKLGTTNLVWLSPVAPLWPLECTLMRPGGEKNELHQKLSLDSESTTVLKAPGTCTHDT